MKRLFAYVCAVVVLGVVVSAQAQDVPDIGVDFLTLDFGEVTIGSPESLFLVVDNYAGTDTLYVYYVSVNQMGQHYAVTDPPLPAPVAPGLGITLTVTFSPTVEGPVYGSLQIQSNDPDENPLEVPLSGNAVMGGEPGGPTVTEARAWFDGAYPGSEWVGAPGDTVWITARVTHAAGVEFANANIDTTGLEDIFYLTLSDDGLHRDGASEDGIYGGYWKTRTDAAMEYQVDIEAVSMDYSHARYDNVLWFSTVQSPPDVEWFEIVPDVAVQGREVTLEGMFFDRDGVHNDSVFVDIERHDDGTRERVFLSFDRFGDSGWGRGAIFKGIWIAGSLGGHSVLLSACDSTGVWFHSVYQFGGVNVVNVVLGTPNHMGILTAPGDSTVKVPIYITNVTGLGILSIELGIDYDPQVLAIPEIGFIETVGTLSEGWGASWDSLNTASEPLPEFPVYGEGSGVLISMAGTDALDSYGGDGILMYLVFDIADGAHHGDQTRLWNSHLLVNEEEMGNWAAWNEGGVTIGEYGDPSGDGTSSPFDASLLLMHAVGLIDLYMPGRQEVAPEDSIDVYDFTHQAADVTGNGQPTAYDAAHILQYAVKLIDHFPAEEAYWPWREGSEFPKPMAPAARQITLAELRPLGAEMFGLPIRMDDMGGVVSGEMTLSYDRNRWQVLGAEKTDLLENTLFADRIKDGKIRIAFAGSDSRTGAGEIALIRLRSLSGEITGDPGFAMDEMVLNEGSVPVTVLLSSASVPEAPSAFRLGQNYPNPFNPSTVIEYDLLEEGVVDLGIYDLAGQKIRTLVNEHRSNGSYSVLWNGKDNRGREVGCGVYFYTLRINDFVQTRKLVVIQ
ncbi:MAG: cohesin domain-containing protein [Candidatus Latescibacterota bacterium]